MNRAFSYYDFLERSQGGNYCCDGVGSKSDFRERMHYDSRGTDSFPQNWPETWRPEKTPFSDTLFYVFRIKLKSSHRLNFPSSPRRVDRCLPDPAGKNNSIPLRSRPHFKSRILLPLARVPARTSSKPLPAAQFPQNLIEAPPLTHTTFPPKKSFEADIR